ncbi:DUF2785 domain-containing protein [Streptococcus saliviloxodontae]|uniref:DUF2785 domain-containing protein n=1 Tax=Streptococcus saliviloxodontae TaxID=1349416 RepID=A0ABS2PLE7_9STRE|nr:DUF2785 domain-containing protein [Streptococcus saliviloxodontae]MBM7636260.1 hypothetical protein [Streptococcus saliviloxodontae]
MDNLKIVLSEKLGEKTTSYSDELVKDMLDRIGHPDCELRDDLIFTTFAKGLHQEEFRVDQFLYLANAVLDRDLLRVGLGQVGDSTLTRSFTSLLVFLLLTYHYEEKSLYFGILEKRHLDYFKIVGQSYLSLEKDLRAFSESYGWVHAPAHFADYYAIFLCYEGLEKEEWENFLDQLELFFKREKHVFTAGESERLAQLIYRPYLKGQLPHRVLVDWLRNLEFSKLEATDYMAFLNFSHFLSAVYIEMTNCQQLDDDLKEVIYRLVTIWE